jgi:hypothetical protein
MSVGLLGGAVSGSAFAGMAILGTSEGLGVYQEALDKGTSETRALTTGAIAGALSTGSEVVLNMFGASAFGRMLSGKVSGNLLKHPFLNKYNICSDRKNFTVDLIHNNGLYIGNNQFVNSKNLNKLESILKLI